MITRCAVGCDATCTAGWLAYSSREGEDASQLFPPQLDAEGASEQVQEVLHRSPVLYGHDRHSWTLDTLRQTVPWLCQVSLPGICQLLRRLKVAYKHGRAHVHSPDLAYNQKLGAIEAALAQARQAPAGEVVFLYEDEFTASLRPLVGHSYRGRSERGQKATGSTGETLRLAGCLDALTGRVVWRRRGSYNVKEMYRFFYYVQKQYPDARVIYVALDNWPVHFHAYVQEHLAKMKPANRIQFLPLPTYAPWTNPAEKYWLKLAREWLRFHPFGGDKQQFIREVDGWLSRHCAPSPALLHEVGLLPN